MVLAIKIIKNRRKIERMQLFSLRLIKGYRTISYNAACVIAGIKPVCLKAEDFQILHTFQTGGVVEEMDGSLLGKPIGFNEWQHPADFPVINMDL